MTPTTDESAASGAPRTFALAGVENPGDIERVEEDDGSVRYTDVMLLAPGKWTDSESRMQVDYTAEGIQNSVDNWRDNTVNLLHDVDNEVSEVGEVDTESVYADDAGNLYADVVLHRENAASEYADEAMQSALESGGAKGLGGPSVEIAEDRLDDSRDPPELIEAVFTGLGLVSNPASKPVDFSRQTARRAVALSEGGESALYTRHMDNHIDPDSLRSRLSEAGVELGDDVDDDELLGAVEGALDEHRANEDDPDDEDDEEESDGDDEPEDDPDDEEEGEQNLEDAVSTLAGTVEEVKERQQAIDERLTSLEDELQQLRSADEELSELQEAIEALADADRVDGLEERLSSLEDEPEEPTSLADAGVDDEGREGIEHTTSFSRHDPVGRSATR